jgi:hypothetical protein
MQTGQSILFVYKHRGQQSPLKQYPKKSEAIKSVSKEIKGYTEEEHLTSALKEIKELYKNLRPLF